MAVINHVHELVKNTPLLYLPTLSSNPNVKVYAKLEHLNPAGGIKDRFGVYAAQQLLHSKDVTAGMTLIEATAGNTGLGLALGFIDAGIDMIFIVPDKFSIEKQILLKSMGATIINTPAHKGMEGAITYADTLRTITPNSFTINQFESILNPQSHIDSTGPEIYNDLEGSVDYFLMGAGSGGTLTGISTYLKSKNPNVKTALVDPVGSALGGGAPQEYKIEGIGNHAPPLVLDMNTVDFVIKVSDEEAMDAVQDFAHNYGIFAGSSSGANLAAAKRLASSLDSGTIVTLILDRGERYFSKHILEEELWKK